MSDISDIAVLEVTWHYIPAYLSKLCTVLALYAVYIVLFLFSLYTIIHRNSSGRRFMLAISSGMFILGTSGMLLAVISMAGELALIKAASQTQPSETIGIDRILQLQNNVSAVSDLRVITNNLLTDLLLLYRCYILWGLRRTVLILPGIFIFSTCLLGYMGTASNFFVTKLPIIDKRIFLATSAATNIFLMCLIAGRILYISRAARIVNQNAMLRRYHTAIAMILESGALYCRVLLLNLLTISFDNERENLYAVIFLGVSDGLVDQMVNILPTLIFVRVGLGHCKWRQETAPVEVRIPGVRTPKRQEEGSPEESNDEVIDIKWNGALEILKGHETM